MNLEKSSYGKTWNTFTSKKSTFKVKTFIGGNIVSDVEKTISVKMHSFQKTVTKTNGIVTDIIITNNEGSSVVKFEKGDFFGINTMPKEPVRITPVIELKEKANDYVFKDTIWNDTPVYKLTKTTPNEDYVFDKESKYLIAYISDNRYGKSTITYSDYKEVDGYMLPFKEEVNIPSAGYKMEILYSDIEINPMFPKDFFTIDKSWASLGIGKSIPEFKLSFVQNDYQYISNKDLTDRITLIDFWATWCKPCIEEFPKIKKVYNKYKNKGFNVVSISIDKDRKRLENYLNKNPFPWEYSLHSEGEFKSDLAKRFQLVTLPKPILIDYKGKIIAMDADLRKGKLEDIIKEIFKD
ncbi:thioredoxin-like domain-containing protein [Winogradskyella haliclonae]|nr:thioredoxin-like domain-containing protein [Winogradskyella haliclonae]